MFLEQLSLSDFLREVVVFALLGVSGVCNAPLADSLPFRGRILQAVSGFLSTSKKEFVAFPGSRISSSLNLIKNSDAQSILFLGSFANILRSKFSILIEVGMGNLSYSF